MKLQILHDESGVICAVFAPTETKRKGGIHPATPEQSVIEAHVPEVALHADGTETDVVNATILHVLENCEVHDGRVIERTQSSAR